MAVTFAEFSSRLRSLYNIDHTDVPWMSAEAWPKFRDDPVRFFIRCDDDTAERIWAVVEWRNRPRPKGALADAIVDIVRTGIPRPLP